MGSSDSDGANRPRKRSRASANSEDSGGKKTRGRPRVDTQDETAADRRRTQIRLAQRAYRQRKETTISSLKEQNDRLQSIIDQMNKSFLQFNEAAIKSGLLQLNPVLAQQLKNVTESFVSLAKSATEGNVDEEEGTDLAEAIPVRSNQNQSTPPQRMDVGWGYSTTLDNSPPEETEASPSEETQSQDYNDLPILPTFNADQASQDGLVQYRRPQMPDLFSQGVSWANASIEQRPSEQPLPFELLDILSRQEFTPPAPHNPNIFSVNIPTPRATPPMARLPSPLNSLTLKSPKPVWTYSYDETTFARRLTRAALETGFHLLGSATKRPAALEHVFRLSLPYLTLDQLQQTFKELLSRGTDEELDSWTTPFLHLGGAGTHYPRKDARGNVIVPPNTWNIRRIGPVDNKLARAQNSQDPSQTHDLHVDLTGFEGEWFDAHDVEGYLEQEKGVSIDPKSSFIDAFVDDDEHPGYPSEMPFALDMGISDFPKMRPIDQPSGFFDQPLGLDLAPRFDTGMTNGAWQPLDFPNPMSGSNVNMSLQALETMPVVRQKRKKKVLIDVTKLVDEIVKHGVCLGRAPGFRRKDVDMAFQASLTTFG